MTLKLKHASGPQVRRTKRFAPHVSPVVPAEQNFVTTEAVLTFRLQGSMILLTGFLAFVI